MNRYADRLGISPPVVEDVWDANPDASWRQLMVVALLENGGPMLVEDVAARLLLAGASPRRGVPFTTSLKKSWRGAAPIRKRADEQYSLDLECWEMGRTLQELGLTKRAPVAPLVVDFKQPGPEVPLSRFEIEAAFRGRSQNTHLRVTAALLEVEGRALTIPEINERLDALFGHRWAMTTTTVRHWRDDLIVVLDDGRLALNPESESIAGMRAYVRSAAEPTLRRAAESEARTERIKAARLGRSERDAELRARAAEWRRALVHVAPTPDQPKAMALVDLGSRQVTTVVGEAAVEELGAKVEAYDVLIGVGIEDVVAALGREPADWRLVDIGPPQRSMRVGTRGRTVELTTAKLVASTVGDKVFGKGDELVRLFEAGDAAGLLARLESEARALVAYYRYGALHDGVWLRHGRVDESVAVDWRLDGDEFVRDFLRRAAAEQRDVELVLGRPGEWDSPWADGRRVQVVPTGSYSFALYPRDGWEAIECDDILDARWWSDNRDH